jgi:hypothetical protein
MTNQLDGDDYTARDVLDIKQPISCGTLDFDDDFRTQCDKLIARKAYREL